MLKRKMIPNLIIKFLPPLFCQRSYKIWCHPLDSVRLSLTLLLFLNKLFKCSSSTNILQYILVFFPSMCSIYTLKFLSMLLLFLQTAILFQWLNKGVIYWGKLINDVSQFSGLFMWMTRKAVVLGWFQNFSS